MARAYTAGRRPSRSEGASTRDQSASGAHIPRKVATLPKVTLEGLRPEGSEGDREQQRSARRDQTSTTSRSSSRSTAPRKSGGSAPPLESSYPICIRASSSDAINLGPFFLPRTARLFLTVAISYYVPVAPGAGIGLAEDSDGESDKGEREKVTHRRLFFFL